jgi:hypothetical protein
MLKGKHNQIVADRINRVITAVDLAEVTPADIDAFLESLGWEPFPEEKIRRILDHSGVQARSGSKANPEAPSPGRKRTCRGGQSTCRLICEELDGRILPSQLGGSWAGRVMDAYQMTASDSSVLGVVIWEDKGLLAVRGFSPSAAEPPAGVPVETLNSLFASSDYQVGGGFDGFGPGEGMSTTLPWNFLAASAGSGHAEGGSLLLAS